MNKSIALLVAALVAAPAAAQVVPYSTDTVTYSGLGDTLGTIYDIVKLNGVTGTFTGSGTYLANNVDFTVGINANTPATHSGTFTDTASAFGSTFTYTVPYTLTISSSDSITLGGSVFHAGGHRIVLNSLTLAAGTGQTSSGALTATVSVPEPATWAMLLTGFAMIGVAARGRRRSLTA